MSLLQMSLSGSVFILLVFVVRLFSINKLPKNTFLILWGLAMSRLLLPFSVPSPLSIYSLMSHSGTFQEMHSDNPIGRLLTVSNETFTLQIGRMNQPEIKSIPIWLIVYVVGAAAIAVFFAVAYFCCVVIAGVK